MEKQEYVKRLRHFLKDRNISLEHYYYSNAVMMRSNSMFQLQDFELENPFITAEDIKKLLYCNDSRIVEYYAYAMSKVIRLYEAKKVVTRLDMKEAINEELDKKDKLGKKEIAEVVNQELDKKSHLSRQDITDVVDEEMVNQDLSRQDIKEVIEEKIEKRSLAKVFITGISKKISDLLNGFAVIREEKTGRAHLYHHNAKTDTLKGEKVFINNQLKVDNGYYVNFEEYIDQMLEEITEKYPYPEEIRFIREDGVERSFKEMMEEAFAILKKRGALRFGKDLAGKKIDTYEDLAKLNLEGTEDYAGEPLRKGIYVRRDILTRIFATYKVRVAMLDEEEDTKGNCLK